MLPARQAEAVLLLKSQQPRSPVAQNPHSTDVGPISMLPWSRKGLMSPIPHGRLLGSERVAVGGRKALFSGVATVENPMFCKSAFTRAPVNNPSESH